MAHRALLIAMFLLALAAPADACTPVVSVGIRGLMAGWLVWLILTPFALGLPSTRTLYIVAVPMGLMGFAVPAFGVLTFVAVLLTVAFPMHLALEFFGALFHREAEHRGFRLFYNGLPLALILWMGLQAKAALYGDNGGFRSLVWNYSREGEAVFFAVWLVVGVVLLVQHRSQHRHLWPV